MPGSTSNLLGVGGLGHSADNNNNNNIGGIVGINKASIQSSIMMAGSGNNNAAVSQGSVQQQHHIQTSVEETPAVPFWDTYDTINQLYMALGKLFTSIFLCICFEFQGMQ